MGSMELNEFTRLDVIAKKLVTERIQGHRSGLPDVPTSLHSLRVQELIKEYVVALEFPYEMSLAAVLHDVVEDGGVSFDELSSLGFSERTVELVRLCTHKETPLGSVARWTMMIATLVAANDEEAWMIKLADLLDNIKESYALVPERRRFMVEVKAELMLKLTMEQSKNHPLWQALAAEVTHQKSLLQLADCWTKDGPYVVYGEDHADYNQDPPVRAKVGEFPSYIQAVDFCREQVRRAGSGEYGEPVSYWIAPEPAGLSFNEKSV